MARGEPLAEVHARDAETAATAQAEVLAAYELADEAQAARRVILDVIA